MRTNLLAAGLFLAGSVFGQNQSPTPAATGMSGLQMSHDQGEAADTAVTAMDGHRMDLGPHMKMTRLRPSEPGDAQKAAEIVRAARAVAKKYADYKLALADGYKIFLPQVPQKQYHFTNYWNAFSARNHFDPSLPTSLLYEKRGNDYELLGVMYTASKDAGDDELNSRIPLSVARWHAHVNLCLPPRDRRQEGILGDVKFGIRGSISSRKECDAAGGRFFPQVFGWMVHVYPFEHNPEDVWSVNRQIGNHED